MRSEIIQNPLIRDNLAVLCEAIKDLDVGPERKATFEFFCDGKSGKIFYTPSSIPAHELVILYITLDLDQKQMSWKTKEGMPLSKMAETHLKEMGEILKKVCSKIDKLAQLSHFEWKAPFDTQDAFTDLRPVWHDVDREGAEKLLLSEPAGTYLVRRDKFAATLQEILRRGHKKTIQCLTLSYIDDEKIVRDQTIIYVNQTWMFYNDDPTLSGPFFRSWKEIISSIESKTKYPLLSKNVIVS